MSLLFFYDFETTGIPDFKEPSDAPQQPHIVQACGQIVDSNTRLVAASVDLIVRPDGWEIPDEVAKVHGITTADAALVGMDESLVVEVMLNMWRACERRVGHNQSFDARIMRIGLKRYATDAVADEWKEGASECTCYQARPYTALPKNKLPKIEEAYHHFFGTNFPGAHTARGDTDACRALYFAIRDNESAGTPA